MIVGGLENVVYTTLMILFGGNTTDDSAVRLYLSKPPDIFMVPIDRNDSSLIDRNQTTYIFFHGLNENYQFQEYKQLANLLTSNGSNVINVDWEELSSGFNYFAVCKRLPLVANVVAQYIMTHNLDASKITLVGLSLGAHVCGLVGKILKKQYAPVDRIFGLDPAGPLFGFLEPVPAYRRLDKCDAKLVVTLASNRMFLGTRFWLGQVNFISNGGTIQPGCPLIAFPPFVCSHQRALIYYIHSITTDKFVGRDAMNTSQLIFGNDVPYTSKGNYYFRTSSQPPYALG